MSTSLADLLSAIGEELFQKPPRWIWHEPAAEMDVSVPLRKFPLHEDFAARLADVEQRHSAEIQRIWRDGDHLNLLLRTEVVSKWVLAWSRDKDMLWEELRFPEQPEFPMKAGAGSWIPQFQAAEVLAGISGWDHAWDKVACDCCESQARSLRNLMRHAEILELGSGDAERRQKNAIDCMVLEIRNLWANPILLPQKPVDSAIRQAWLRIFLAFAWRAGARWKQP